MNQQRFKANFDKIQQAEELARETIANELEEK